MRVCPLQAYLHYTQCLTDFFALSFVAAHQLGVEVRSFARENSIRVEAAGSVLDPDCAFQLVTLSG
jgi:hypothetical protein